MIELSHTDLLLAELAAEKLKPVPPQMMALAEKFRDRVMCKHSPAYRDLYEVKTFEVVCSFGGGVSVVVETGRIGDEGTAASILCRDYRHVRIGKRGGITLLNAKSKSNKKRLGWFAAVHYATI